MIAATPRDGDAIEVPSADPAYRGPSPPATVAELRRLLSRALVDLGAGQVQDSQVMGMSPSTTSRVLKAEAAEVDESLPPDEPPGFGPPGPRRAPAFVELSGRFVRSLREQYLEGTDSRSRRIGTLDDVAEWLAGLKPGKVKPRESAR